MAHDTFGKGQFVQHGLLQNERWSTLLTALEEFKFNNPTWTKMKCMLVDKDFTEMSVLKQAFPGVTVLLCQFYVLKYVREEIASSDYCFNAWQKDQLRGVMSLLVYAMEEAEYAKHFKYMVHLASIGFSSRPQADISVGHESGRDGRGSGQDGQTSVSNDGSLANEESTCEQHPFVAYLSKNWDNCRELWCAHKRQNAVTLRNNTNNRLESLWKQLKEWVDSSMAVDECIASIMY
ncbi:hypothetical protein PF005_g11792 [Phytophthora fragariae]|uniref:ZSWIM1/3 RNaseH-like domain-containing protein n=2 Tax=Phytophthora fragariae TaxID=53985 RepID=A0A6A3S4S8_9STRA|nr:hypothetical protein PF009_g12581 [Phytophthora fragariae]KAE9109958.1 hypothetical protein PF007_g12046 [Phytophthora fragariae]KAE9124613.1 hypothetical protein PF010_g5948 [Phytophthora fragariae]KAE9209532.1 hypothetical protein PF005_g11792 [Phytophthora fragariae]KAE9304551.1 hypothetical protein PF001_g13016 [Phytophthora fragariae]